MIVFGGRRGCGCGGCLTILILMFIVFAFLQAVRVPGHGPQPIHPVYPVTATPTGGGGFSAGRLPVIRYQSFTPQDLH